MATRAPQPPGRDPDDAKALADRLLKGIEEGERLYEPEPLEIYVADVEAAIDRFALELMICREFGTAFPCLATKDGLVPIDWLPGAIFFPWPYAEPHEILKKWPFRFPADYPPFFWTERPPEEQAYEMAPPIRALESLRNQLVSFLTIRFGARKSNISAAPGHLFEVITHRSGLRVHFSDSYFINWSNVFGSPTTPVRAWIQPGRYKFGAVGQNFPFRYDPANFDVPPLTQAQLVNI